MKKLTTFLILLANLITCQAQETSSVKKDICDCPEPTREQYISVCVSIFQKSSAYEEDKGLSFAYEEQLWKLSCAVPGVTSKEEAKLKIQCMWNKYKEKFRCYSYPTSIATDKNVLKFSLDTGFTPFLYQAVRKLNLDMNFLDPSDNETILDFIKEREEYIRNDPPIDEDKAKEYQKYYELLKANGAKHSYELNK